MATVSSGDGQKTFYLHEALLCYESERFVKQLTSGFSESATRTISECEEDPDLFACFVEYFYRDAWVNNHDIVHDSDYVMLAQLYSLGERLGADRFQEPYWGNSPRSSTLISSYLIKAYPNCLALSVASCLSVRARIPCMSWCAGMRRRV